MQLRRPRRPNQARSVSRASTLASKCGSPSAAGSGARRSPPGTWSRRAPRSPAGAERATSRPTRLPCRGARRASADRRRGEVATGFRMEPTSRPAYHHSRALPSDDLPGRAAAGLGAPGARGRAHPRNRSRTLSSTSTKDIPPHTSATSLPDTHHDAAVLARAARREAGGGAEHHVEDVLVGPREEDDRSARHMAHEDRRREPLAVGPTSTSPSQIDSGT